MFAVLGFVAHPEFKFLKATDLLGFVLVVLFVRRNKDCGYPPFGTLFTSYLLLLGVPTEGTIFWPSSHGIGPYNLVAGIFSLIDTVVVMFMVLVGSFAKGDLGDNKFGPVPIA